MPYPRSFFILCLAVLALATCPLARAQAPAQEKPAGPVPGERPAPFSLPDASDALVSSAGLTGKVVIVNHADPSHMNVHQALTDAVKRSVEEGALSRDTVMGLGVADCQTSCLPKPVIRAFGEMKARKYDSTVLYDYDGALRRDWNLPPESSTVVILDKEGVCRFVTNGGFDPARIPEVIALIKNLQEE